MNSVDLAWAAGLIDGEGCITVAKQCERRDVGKYRYKAKIIVAMSHKETILRLQHLFGGCVSQRKTKEGRKRIDVWEVSCNSAFRTLEKIAPFLFTKKEEAAVLLRSETLMTCGTKGKRLSEDVKLARVALYEELKRLKE